MVGRKDTGEAAASQLISDSAPPGSSHLTGTNPTNKDMKPVKHTRVQGQFAIHSMETRASKPAPS